MRGRHAFFFLITYHSSLVSESYQRVYFGRAARGEGAGDERDGRQQEREPRVGQRVCRRDLEELALHQPRQRERAEEPDAHAQEREPHPAPQHERENGTRLRAEREADAYLLRVLRDEEGEHAVYAERRQGEREPREDREQRHADAALRRLLAENLLHRLHVRYGLRRVNRVDLTPHRGDQALRLDRSAYDEVARREPLLIVR